MKLSDYKSEIVTDYLIAEKIICADKAFGQELFLNDTPRQAVLGNNKLCTLKSGGYILLDFGCELQGGVSVTVQETVGTDVKLRVVFGESVMEALSNIGEKNSGNDHSPRDIVSPVVRYSTFRVGQTGFRFVKLEAVDGDISFGGVSAAFEHRDIEFKGSFESDDSLLNKIWYTGARTVYLNMQEYLFDGIKRDRLVWIGDMHAETAAISSVFGDCSIVNKSLDLVMEVTPIGKWMNDIPSYSLWWLIIQYEWYVYTGNLIYIQKNADYIIKHIRHILSAVQTNGIDGFSGCMGGVDEKNPYKPYFVDWETYGSPQSRNGFYAIFVMALQAAEVLADLLGDSVLSKACRTKVNTVKAMAFPPADNRQIASLMALAGLADVCRVNQEILLREPVADISAYLGYYILLAKGESGDIQGGIDIVKRYWGRMLELGATTFWESFDYLTSYDAVGIDKIVQPGEKDIHGDFGKFCYRNRRCSLCHGWACGPTPFLSKYVLGVKVLEPGCAVVEVKPQLGNLNYVHGSFPTPRGIIEITAEQTCGKIKSDIKAPAGIQIIK